MSKQFFFQCWSCAIQCRGSVIKIVMNIGNCSMCAVVHVDWIIHIVSTLNVHECELIHFTLQTRIERKERRRMHEHFENCNICRVSIPSQQTQQRQQKECLAKDEEICVFFVKYMHTLQRNRVWQTSWNTHSSMLMRTKSKLTFSSALQNPWNRRKTNFSELIDFDCNEILFSYRVSSATVSMNPSS